MRKMKYFCIAFMIFGLLISISNSHADQVYTWTDDKGNLHLTDSPPPANAKIQDVVRVEKKSASEIEEEQVNRGREKADYKNEKIQNKIKRAKFEARQADQRAQEAVAQAQETTRNADEYVRRIGSNRARQKRFRGLILRLKQEVETAQAAANAAVEQARQAAEKVQKLEKEAAVADQAAAQGQTEQ